MYDVLLVSLVDSVSEIFDAAAPHHPRGCVAQAWGVAEVLRVIKAYDLVNDMAVLPTVKKLPVEGTILLQ